MFSRKSTIILAGVIAIHQSVRREELSSARPSRKRTRGDPSISAIIPPDAIDLPKGADIARVDDITLPAPKRRRGRTYGLSPLESQLELSRGSMSPGRLAQLDDVYINRSAEVDLVAAMDTLFPAIAIPRLGEHISSHKSIVSSVDRSGSQYSQSFRAREEDITLANVHNLESLGNTLFNEEVGISDSAGPSELAQALFMDVGDEALGLAEPLEDLPKTGGDSTPSGRRALSQPDTSDLGMGGFEPLDMAPLQFESTPSPPYRGDPSEDLQSSEGQLREGTGNIEVVKARASVHSSAKTSVRASESKEVAGEVDAVEANTEDKVSIREKSRTATKKKRMIRAIVDNVTEISPKGIRSFLNDTSDLITSTRRDRGARRNGNAKRDDEDRTVRMPGFISVLATELQEFWMDMTGGVNKEIDDSGAGQEKDISDERHDNVLQDEDVVGVVDAQDRVVGEDDAELFQTPAAMTGGAEEKQDAAEMERESTERMRAGGELRPGVADMLLEGSGSRDGTSNSGSAGAKSNSVEQFRKDRDKLFDMVSLYMCCDAPT